MTTPNEQDRELLAKMAEAARYGFLELGNPSEAVMRKVLAVVRAEQAKAEPVALSYWKNAAEECRIERDDLRFAAAMSAVQVEAEPARQAAPSEEDRERFEQFYRTRSSKGVKHREERLARLEDGSYADLSTARHWWTWQNALATSKDRND